MSHPILIVEDDSALSGILSEGLQRRGYAPQVVAHGEAALALLQERAFEAVITDINMKGMNGLVLCERLVAGHPGLPVLVITAFGSLETAIQAIRAGAYDFITKPFELETLTLAIGRAVQHRELREEVKRLRQEVSVQKKSFTLLGESQGMRELVSLINRVADSESNVLLSGERGTGKASVAKAIHEASRRREKPFVALSCASVPAAMLSAELFGDGATPGAFERAHEGTLFLDDVVELPLEIQPQLLRTLREQAVESHRDFGTRVITASERDLETAVEEKRFREDLYFAINVINLHLPPLRIRGNDVLLLAQYFLRHFAERARKEVSGLATSAAERLLSYAWPGNVTELQNVIERAVAVTQYSQITAEDLPPRLQRSLGAPESTSDDDSLLLPLETIERHHILRVLKAVGGHRSQAAKILGLDRKTLYRKLESYSPEELAGTTIGP